MEIKSAWLSKINWTQAIALVCGLLTYAGYTVPADVQNAVLAGIIAASTVITWALRTFSTKSITPAVAAKL